MEGEFTTAIKKSTAQYSKSIENLDDAINFFKDPDSFRKFDEGITELFKRKNYPKDLNNKIQMADFLFEKLQSIGSQVNYETVAAWITGKHTPKIEAGSRKRIYEICFAMNLTYNDTIWFFSHVYLDRAFNCHNLSEAVYYYAFKNHLTYKEAQEIINDVSTSNSNNHNENHKPYTEHIKSMLDYYTSVDKLKEYLILNKNEFNTWNQSAYIYLKKQRKKLIGNEEFKPEIDKFKRKLKNILDSPSPNTEKIKIQNNLLDSIKKHNDCGLILKEIIFDADYQQHYEIAEKGNDILEKISNKNIFANSFILDYFIFSSTGIKKHINIPEVAKLNFPSKKTMSDVLDETKISISQSYDAIRKMIVLFEYYIFWVEIKLGITDTTDIEKNLLPEIFIDQINSTLIKHGYETLFDGNPYDWLFICSSKNSDPLDFFKACILEIMDYNDAE